MKRGGFKRATPERAPKSPMVFAADREQRGRMVAADAMTCAPVEKENPARHERYLRIVAKLPCMNCGIDGYSNACHGDATKGLGIKSDDRTCWPGCVDRPGIRGCHSLFGASGVMPREERRRLEAEYARRTRLHIRELGLWPADLEWME